MTAVDPSKDSSKEPAKSNWHASLPVPLMTRLREFAGSYQGQGLNHEGEKFRGEFELAVELDGSLATISFQAIDESDATSAGFHNERTWITDDLITGGTALWTVSTNTPGVLRLPLIEDSADGSYLSRVTFRLGDPKDETRFREQIFLGLRHDRAIEYVYSWGVPHQKFDVRSKCLLARI